MGLFRPYQSNDASSQAADPSAPAATASQPTQGKGAPTPSRRDAEQLRRARLHPTLSKREIKARERELRRVREDKVWANVEMRPERVLLRNFIDARWTFAEFSWPMLFLALAMFVAGTWFPQMAIWGSYAIWVIMFAVLLEVAYMWMQFRRLLDKRVPDAPRRGLLMYMASRMVAMRRYRRPPTAIDRGAAF